MAIKNIMEALEKSIEQHNNTSETENGALGYKTTGKKLLDLNFMVSSLRQETDDRVIERFEEAYNENPELAMKWLFFTRDIISGLGEKRLFRLCFAWFIETHGSEFIYENLVKLVPEYGSFKDLFLLRLNDIDNHVITSVLIRQLKEDFKMLNEWNGQLPVPKFSLCAKWAPSLNCHDKDRIRAANDFCRLLNLTPKQYRQSLSKIRAQLNIVERDMSANRWGEINYSKVASVANMRYSNAFSKHDYKRRTEFLNNVIENKDGAKINSGVLYPHNIVSQITHNLHNYEVEDNLAAEAAWKSYPKKILRNTLVVADGSGSMTTPIDNGSTALDVANSLAIYFSECNVGVFKNKYITFSELPQFVDLTVPENCKNPLATKLKIAMTHCEVASTNIEAVFNIILKMACDNQIKQYEMPKSILILSDMEFNEAVVHHKNDPYQDKLFSSITKKYQTAGYELPKIIFWNINSRTKTIPLIENKNGVALLSGYSPNNLKMVLSDELDPWKILTETITGKRYEEITLVKE